MQFNYVTSVIHQLADKLLFQKLILSIKIIIADSKAKALFIERIPV